MQLLNIILLTAIQTDTLTVSYSDKWEAASNLEHSSGLMAWFASNELIYVVGAVSLIIWFGILFYLIKIEKKLTALENQSS